MSIKHKIQELFDPELRRARKRVREIMDELEQRIENGEDIGSMYTRLVFDNPEWDQARQTWVVEIEGMNPGKKMAFIRGRGGKTMDRATAVEALTEPDGEGMQTFSIKFEDNLADEKLPHD